MNVLNAPAAAMPANLLTPKTTRRVVKFATGIGITPAYFINRVTNDWLTDHAYIPARVRAAEKAAKKAAKAA